MRSRRGHSRYAGPAAGTRARLPARRSAALDGSASARSFLSRAVDDPFGILRAPEDTRDVYAAMCMPAGRAVRNRSESVTVVTPRGEIEVLRQEMRGLRRGSSWSWFWLAHRKGSTDWSEASTAREAIRRTLLLPPRKLAPWSRMPRTKPSARSPQPKPRERLREAHPRSLEFQGSMSRDEHHC